MSALPFLDSVQYLKSSPRCLSRRRVSQRNNPLFYRNSSPRLAAETPGRGGNAENFLTADDRIGDLMREQLTADATYAAVKKMDPRMPERGEYASASFGADWAAYCIDWATEYQRTGETKWLDKIRAGMATQLDLAAKPGQLLGAGPHDPSTGKFMPGGRGGVQAFPSQFNQVNPPDVPSPCGKPPGNPRPAPTATARAA